MCIKAEWAEKTANCAGEFKGAEWQEMNANNLAVCKRVIKAGLPVNSGHAIGVPLVTVGPDARASILENVQTCVLGEQSGGKGKGAKMYDQRRGERREGMGGENRPSEGRGGQ